MLGAGLLTYGAICDIIDIESTYIVWRFNLRPRNGVVDYDNYGASYAFKSDCNYHRCRNEER